LEAVFACVIALPRRLSAASAAGAARPGAIVRRSSRSSCSGTSPVFTGEGIRIVRTPVRAPNANAHVERWVGSVRRECLDRLLIFGRRQLEHVLRVYVRHYNCGRPHRALDLQPPDSTAVASARGDLSPPLTGVHRLDLLGGLIHEYELAPAA
jgi:putative transposase